MYRYKGNSVLGILRECHGMWERRAPLSPNHVKMLLQQNPNSIKVLVQPCTRRIFSNEEYSQAGAIVSEDLTESSIILGVKSPPLDILLRDKSYVFFSHTIKAQPGSMPLLDTVLDRNICLFDYECITKDGRDDMPRLVAFGAYAGRAGMIDGLQGLGLKLLAEGYSTPFLHVPNTYMHSCLHDVRDAFRKVGELIVEKGLPRTLFPLVVAFTGTGNVAKGAREIFELLPHEYISVEELPHLAAMIAEGRKSKDKLYGVICAAKDMVVHKHNATAPFSKENYYRKPYEYIPIFHEKVLPYTTLFVNGIYWDDRFPRLVTKEQIKSLRAQGNRKLKAVADISCDINGSCEFLTRPTSIENPFYTYHPESDIEYNNVNGDGILVLGVDNLPSELPKDASNHFGDRLLPLLSPLLSWSGSINQSGMNSLSPELYRACIASHGELMPKWKYISRLREKREHTLHSATVSTIAASTSTSTPAAHPEVTVPTAAVTIELIVSFHFIFENSNSI
jgi:alpha-aminoadipic semialdehyde synthase